MAEIPAVVCRLAAILVADVAGYSRLIEADEEGTLGRLKALRAGVIDPKIARHHGRIVKTTGDGLLVEFASVVDALRCAADTSAPPNRKSAGRRCQAAVASSAMTSAIVRCVVNTQLSPGGTSRAAVAFSTFCQGP
jgi:class 3 adenylate cyclase